MLLGRHRSDPESALTLFVSSLAQDFNEEEQGKVEARNASRIRHRAFTRVEDSLIKNAEPKHDPCGADKESPGHVKHAVCVHLCRFFSLATISAVDLIKSTSNFFVFGRFRDLRTIA